MKTTLAILGIFAAAVMATSFVATGYALTITQSNTGSSTAAGVQDSSGSALASGGGLFSLNNNGNLQSVKSVNVLKSSNYIGCSAGANC